MSTLTYVCSSLLGKITKLKIDRNPFAKGFRDPGRNRYGKPHCEHQHSESTPLKDPRGIISSATEMWSHIKPSNKPEECSAEFHTSHFQYLNTQDDICHCFFSTYVCVPVCDCVYRGVLDGLLESYPWRGPLSLDFKPFTIQLQGTALQLCLLLFCKTTFFNVVIKLSAFCWQGALGHRPATWRVYSLSPHLHPFTRSPSLRSPARTLPSTHLLSPSTARHPPPQLLFLRCTAESSPPWEQTD